MNFKQKKMLRFTLTTKTVCMILAPPARPSPIIPDTRHPCQGFYCPKHELRSPVHHNAPFSFCFNLPSKGPFKIFRSRRSVLQKVSESWFCNITLKTERNSVTLQSKRSHIHLKKWQSFDL